MVCFKVGIPFKAHYRKFKIRTVKGIDDFAMMKEVVSRRCRKLKDEGEPLPDLILVDGGKGQLKSAMEAVKASGLKIPLAALAKREEEVFLPGKKDPVLLERNRPGLHLLQHLRDEAHRFAITFHRSLRDKEFLR